MQEADITNVGDVEVRLLTGSGGGFAVRRGANRFEYYWDKLEEFNSGGSIAQLLPDFDKAEGDWSAFTETTVSGVPCQAAEYVAILPPELREVNIIQTGSGNINVTFGEDVTFRCKVAVFTQPGTLSLNGIDSMQVAAGQIRVEFVLDSWVFGGTANRLYLGVRVQSQGGVQPQTVALRQQPGTNRNILLMGPAAVLMPRINSHQRTVDMYAYDSARKCLEWCFRAPGIGATPVQYAMLIDTVSMLATTYDPTLINLPHLPGRPTPSGGSSTKPASTTGAIVGVTILVLLLAASAGLALYWYFVIRKRAKEDEEDDDDEEAGGSSTPAPVTIPSKPTVPVATSSKPTVPVATSSKPAAPAVAATTTPATSKKYR